MKVKHQLLALAGAAALSALSIPANAQSGINVGTLVCDVSGGIGLIVGSSKSAECQFNKSGGGVEAYTGRVNKFGLDIGVTGKTIMAWVVIAPGSIGPGALAGNYAGAQAGAAVGVGLGANALIGGLGKSVALQPLSVQGQTGVNVAAGIGSLTLTAR